MSGEVHRPRNGAGFLLAIIGILVFWNPLSGGLNRAFGAFLPIEASSAPEVSEATTAADRTARAEAQDTATIDAPVIRLGGPLAVRASYGADPAASSARLAQAIAGSGIPAFSYLGQSTPASGLKNRPGEADAGPGADDKTLARTQGQGADRPPVDAIVATDLTNSVGARIALDVSPADGRNALALSLLDLGDPGRVALQEIVRAGGLLPIGWDSTLSDRQLDRVHDAVISLLLERTLQ